MKNNLGTPLKVDYIDHGICIEHNMPCAIYPDNFAVIDCSSGIFQPSWKAQREGYIILKIKNKFIKKLLKKYFSV